jgi:excisionase family DNA binding protein
LETCSLSDEYQEKDVDTCLCIAYYFNNFVLFLLTEQEKQDEIYMSILWGKLFKMASRNINNNRTGPQKEYLTTTELAKFCGVSRFTILSWIDKGKITTIRTVGGKHRIPVSEAISFLETLQHKTSPKEKKVTTSGALGHCWEYLQKTNCERECKNCLIYGREIDYCFVVVRQFGKGVIRCTGDCLSCGYFEKFFGSHSNSTKQEQISEEKAEEADTEKKIFLDSFIHDIAKGGDWAKEPAANLMENSYAIALHKNKTKKSLSNLPEYKINELATITETILKELDDVQMIILFGSYARGNWIEDVCSEKDYTYEYKSDFDILVVTKYAETANNPDLQHKLEGKLNRTETTVNLIFHDIQFINAQLNNGQYFFSDIQEEGAILYDSGRFGFPKKRKLNIEKRKKTAQQDFDQWYEKAKRFYNHFQKDLEKKWYNEALFELHQSIRCFYTTMLSVFCGYKPQNCDLEKLGRYVASYEPSFLTVFHCTTERQDKMFKLLNNANNHICNENSQNITKVDLAHLEQRAQKLMELTRESCKKKIDSFA